jgi:hypothetical protein
MLFHVDSGAGQSLCSNKDAFISLQACAIQMIGVSGSFPILGLGTAMFVVVDAKQKPNIFVLQLPNAIPPARRTYDSENPAHMADLSVRWMDTGDERLRRTLDLNRVLTPTTGRVCTLKFPKGKFVQGQTPKVLKDKVHHLHRASICEVVFTDRLL